MCDVALDSGALVNDDRVFGSAMPSAKLVKSESERSRRNQGFTDGLAGRPRRQIGDAFYGEGFRRGTEKRERDL